MNMSFHISSNSSHTRPRCHHRVHHNSHFNIAVPINNTTKPLLLQHNRNPKLKTINMGDLGPDQSSQAQPRKPRIMCLHGFRTSGQIMKTQIGKWPESVRDKLDLVFVDGPFPAGGKSDVEGIFDPPYYEWFQFDKEFTIYRNFDKCLEYVEECMIKYGPFDGLMGFSQGSILSAAMPGFQAKGLALTKVPKIKCLIIIGGGLFRSQEICDQAYSEKDKIDCASLHFLGETDFLRPFGEILLKYFVDPFIIHHPKGHTVPRLDEKSLEIMNSFIEKIQKIVSSDNESNPAEEEKEAAFI